MNAPNTPVSPKGFCRLDGSHRVPLQGASKTKAADPGETVHISLHIRRGRQFQTGDIPDQQHWSKNSPLKHQAFSHQELSSKVAASADDIKAVTDYLQSKGLVVTEADATKRSVRAEGPVQKMEDAFAVKLHYYQNDQHTYRGREGDIYLPDQLGAIVKGVF